ncbi:hypothetical protein [Paenibacillus wenxiniae]|uniref:DUF5348 domain-containing protein n=1 Tax=Paenibacillus wenxiniae TaxID=1636843 RepID=A0ABW4RHL3_9BACL
MLDLISFIDGKIKQMHISGAAPDDLHKLILLKKVALHLMKENISSTVDDIVQIEDEATGYCEYRIVNDGESDDRSLWMEYKEGKVRLHPGDWLIKMK